MALGYLPISNIRTLFIANTFTGTISEINTATDSVMNVTTPTGTVNAIPLNMYPYSLDYNNGYLYVTGFTQSTGLLESLNLLTNQTTSTVNLKGYPFKARLITQTSMLYVIDSDNNNNFYLESFTVSSVITPSTFTTLTFTPTAMALSPDDKSIFVSYQGQSFVSIFDPATLDNVGTIDTDHPVTAMHALNQYANTMLYAVVFTGTGYNLESINISSGTIGYEFTLPGVPYGMAISPQRVLLDDNHFSYLGIVANANGYIDFLNIDHGCNIPAIPSTYTGLILTSTVQSANLPSLQAITTNDCTTQSETWTVVYNASSNDYTVSGSVSGLQPTPATNGSFFDASNDAVSFYINPGSVQLNNNDMFSFNTVAAQQIRAILGPGFPQQVIIDPVTNQAFISDILTYLIYAVSPSTQTLITTIR
jgi:glutamine cyclotransferase